MTTCTWAWTTAPPRLPRKFRRSRFLMPGNGDIVGSRLAIVFETPADIGKMTMGHHMMGTHLHVEAGDTVLMPSQEQLVRLGANRYLFLFDLPAQAGTTGAPCLLGRRRS